MSFSLDLTDEQTALREKAHVFARDVIRPVAPSMTARRSSRGR